MKIIVSRKYQKNLEKRFRNNSLVKKRLVERLILLLTDCNDPILQNHALKGEMIGNYSFSVTGNIRVIYTIYQDTFTLLDIGTHNQVY